MRIMARALLLVLVVAFAAGAWQARFGEERVPASSPAPFRTAPLERARPDRPPPALVSVRASGRDGHDRVLFTFRGPLPGYRVGYASRVTDQAGRPLALRGQAFLAVTFLPARARDPGGEPTFDTGPLTPGLPALRQVRFAGDFEGQVRFGIGVADRGGFRVTELGDPARVAVDVR